MTSLPAADVRRRVTLVAALVVALLPFTPDLHAQGGGVPFAAVADSARLAPTADVRVSYGAAAAQFAELRLPRGAGPHAVVFLLHGGCWLNAYGVEHVAGIAESLRGRGIAVFAPEYRRVGDAGAGIPGTFDDVREAYDSLRALAPRHALDLSRVILMGHSAGGHLALWLASEPGVRVHAVLALAAVTDLAAFAAPSGCGSALPLLVSGSALEQRERYAALSPASRPSPADGTQVVLVTASADRIVPQAQVNAYLSRFPSARVLRVPGGHFDLVAPWSAAWSRVLELSADLAKDR